MPPELMELYNLYQQELQTRNNEKEANFLSELNTMLRVNYFYLGTSSMNSNVRGKGEAVKKDHCHFRYK